MATEGTSTASGIYTWICVDCYLLSLLCMYVNGLCHRKNMYKGRARVRCLFHIVRGLHPHRGSNIDSIGMRSVPMAVGKKPNQICWLNKIIGAFIIISSFIRKHPDVC